jgi:transposase-like protein
MTTDTELKLRDALRDIEEVVRDVLTSPWSFPMYKWLRQIERITSEAMNTDHTCPVCGRHHILTE